MKKISVLLLLLSANIWAQPKESFITKEDYAEMLYKDPRGISCAKCHGLKGEGMVIAHYKAKGKQKVLQTMPIYQLDYSRFKQGIDTAKGIMPKYYLTEKEIAALYFYVQQVNTTKKENP